MADPKLVLALEARLNKFESQLKEAGVIADRAVKDIEDKFSRANPSFKGTFLGSFLGTLTAGAVDEFVRAIASIPQKFKEIESAAEFTGLAIEKVFAIGVVSNNIDQVNASLERMASLLDRARRGEKNSLAELLSINNIDINSIKDVEQLWLRIADLARNAKNPIQAREIVEASGAVKSLTGHLQQGSEALKAQQDEAEKTAPDLQKLSDIAKDFDREWEKAVMNFKKYILENLGGVQIRMADFVLSFINLLDAIREAGTGFRQYFGIDEINTGIIDRIKAAAESLKALGEANSARRPFVRVGGDGTSLPPPVGGGAEKERLDTVQKFIIAQEKANEVQQAEIDTLFASNAERRVAVALAEAHAAAKRAQRELTEEEIEQIKQLAAANAQLNQTLEARKPLADFARDAANVEKQFVSAAVNGLRGFEDALVDIINQSATAEEAFRKLANSIINDLIRIGIRMAITGPIASALGGALGGNPIAALPIPPRFQHGGFLGSGKWGIAGEAGPELIRGPAQVISNPISRSMMTGGEGGMNVVVNSYNADVQTEKRNDRQLEITVRGLVRDELGGGNTNSIMRQKYGISPKGIPRG